MTISNMRKLAAIERHLAMLGRIGARVEHASQVFVLEEIAVMQAIAADYKVIVERETPRLFAGHEEPGGDQKRIAINLARFEQQK